MDIASIINMKREECADCHPPLQDLIIRLNINRQSLCGWRVNETIHESCGSKANNTSHIHFICLQRHRQIRQENRGYISFHLVVFVFCHVSVYSTEDVRGRDVGNDEGKGCF